MAATTEMLKRIVEVNDLDTRDVASAYFSTTTDVNAEFPAVAARMMGWSEVPLICGHEMAVPGSLAKCLRVLILFNTNKHQDEIVHVYLNGAKDLRKDLGPRTGQG